MDLQTAAKRYEEIRRFWAQEIAGLLMRRGAKSQIAALRVLAENGGLVHKSTLLVPNDATYTNVHSRDASATQLCRYLLRAGLVTRQRRSLGQFSHPFFYALTELGGLVLNCIPEDYAVGWEKIPDENNIRNSSVGVLPKHGSPR